MLTLQERIFVTEQYFAHKSYKNVSEMFQAKFPGKDMLNKSTMSYIIAKFRQHGTVCNLPHDREKTALTLHVLATVSSELAPNNPGTFKSLLQVVCKHRKEGLSYGIGQQKPLDFIHTEFVLYTSYCLLTTITV